MAMSNPSREDEDDEDDDDDHDDDDDDDDDDDYATSNQQPAIRSLLTNVPMLVGDAYD